MSHYFFQLQLFSLQVLHRDNTLSVKALTIDATLLTAVIKKCYYIFIFNN